MSACVGTQGPLRRVRRGKRITSLLRGEDGLVDVTWILTLECGHVARVKERVSMPSQPLRVRCRACSGKAKEEEKSDA